MLANPKHLMLMLSPYLHSLFLTRPLTNLLVAPISINVILTPDAVYKALQKAKKTLFVGPDAIPSISWQSVAAALILLISILFTLFYIFSKLPLEWKDTTVMPLYKKVTRVLLTTTGWFH